MDFKKRFQEIAEFLQPYQRIWENEIMLLYPKPLESFPNDWISDLAQFKNQEDVIKLSRKEVKGFVTNPSLIEFYQRLEELSQVPTLDKLAPFPEQKNSFLHMIPKKQHEIKNLAPFVNHFYQKHGIKNIIDIGGGVGHLAQTLTSHYQLKTTTLDMDPVLQETGRVRFKRNDVSYINVKVDAENESFRSILEPDSLTLGLHTCGPLAVHQIKGSSSSQIKGLINFGCCYEKLLPYPESQNISKLSKTLSHPLVFNRFALTLATRAHRKMNDKDYELKLKVKYYRYAIHFLFHDEYGIESLTSLGNSHPSLYDESFASYALKQFETIKIPLKHSTKELDQYYSSEKLQTLIWNMLSADLIRNAFGRVMELYILLDRAIYLEETGYSVQLLEFFEEPLSPRNLGIVASLRV
jgi:hypothetical protein